MIKKTLKNIVNNTATEIKNNKDNALKYSLYITIITSVVISISWLWSTFGQLAIICTAFPIICYFTALTFGSSDGRS